jgi:demethylmenaquinone methyltransferase/2-methoxy-6-polyprenyl-1,4-benzoquinol methylase
MTEPKMVLEPGEKKKHYVQRMFNSIAHRYDFLNHFLSFGIDIIWRKKAIRKLNVTPGQKVLDLASGTADFALEIIRQKQCTVVGADIALRMLQFARQKSNDPRLHLVNADGETLPFKDRSFAGSTIAFGIRNMGDRVQALREMYRVLQPEGQAVILEFSLPTFLPFRLIYLFYFKNILPMVGRMVSKDKQAYSYLPASVERFPTIGEFEDELKTAGFTDFEHWKLFNGVAVIYKARKR